MNHRRLDTPRGTTSVPDFHSETWPAACLSGASDRDLLAALLASPLPPTTDAGALLQSHGSLDELFRAARNGLAVAEAGDDGAWQWRLAAALELCRRRLLEKLSRGACLTEPGQVVDFLRHTLKGRKREVFLALFLDTRHRVLAVEELFHGTIDGAAVYPRIVAERALRLGAAALIVAHNHPSGIAEPSLADQSITRRLKDALALLEIRLLDHLVIGDDDSVSLASRGLV